MNPLLQVPKFGQQIWLDDLSRTLLNEGELARLIVEDGISGVTTNPSIFHKAITNGRYYEDDIERLKSLDLLPEARYEQLVIADVQRACDLLHPLHTQSRGKAGYVSLEVSPRLAHDAEATIAAARRLRSEVARSNLLIKIPATPAGRVAIEELVSIGINVNVTLLFSLAQLDQTLEACVRGLERRHASREDLARAMLIFSLFLSRVDSTVDPRLAELGGNATRLQGKVAVALAKTAYQHYLACFQSTSFTRRSHGGTPQALLLWASTGTKNPAYSDLLYVEPLIGPNTITTLPEVTMTALRDHGQIAATLTENTDEAAKVLQDVSASGLNLDDIGETLQADGLAQFEEAHARILGLL